MKTLEERRDAAMNAIDKLYQKKARTVARAKAARDPARRRALWIQVERISDQILTAARTADRLCKAAEPQN